MNEIKSVINKTSLLYEGIECTDSILVTYLEGKSTIKVTIIGQKVLEGEAVDTSCSISLFASDILKLTKILEMHEQFMQEDLDDSMRNN